jgi:D-arabinose 1-dehydrogenase-like Zn-dependent alcohol dehydrogenase
MTTKVPADAATAAKFPLTPSTVERQEPGDHDVVIDILYCGVCHSDIHQVRDEWGGSLFPMVPGHEIIGRVIRTGAGVTRFKNGDLAGVGCMVDWCRECEWNCKSGDRVGVVGLGGLGHMAVRLAASMGAEVTMLSTSRRKEEDARRLGAHAFALTSDEATFAKLAGHFDLIIDTISAPHDYNKYLGMLRPQSTMVVVGVPPQPTPVHALSLIGGNKRLAGSLIGGIAETQEVLDYCGAHKIVSEVEIIPIQKINEAYERMLKGDVRYRFVIDIASLKTS